MKDWPLKDKLYAYSLKVEIPSRLRPLSQNALKDLLYKTDLTECGKNEFSGIVNIEGAYGVELVQRKVPVTLKVKDAAKQILIVFGSFHKRRVSIKEKKE